MTLPIQTPLFSPSFCRTQKSLIDGPVGKIEIAIDAPDNSNQPEAIKAIVRGIALVAHPHPLFGGTMDNKVTQTLARTFTQLGYLAVRANFRGVGASEGEHDQGIGEQDDLMAVIHYIVETFGFSKSVSVVLAGFSFGTFVLSHVAKRLQQRGICKQRLVFAGTAVSRWTVAAVPEDTLVIHGEQDDIVPISAVYDWARAQQLPVIVIPGADHFFHRKLHLIKRVIVGAWRV